MPTIDCGHGNGRRNRLPHLAGSIVWRSRWGRRFVRLPVEADFHRSSKSRKRLCTPRPATRPPYLMLNYNNRYWNDPMKRYLFLLALPLLATDWPQWRGVERAGISKETGLLKSWPKDGPPLAWKTQGLGEGYSAFSISGGLLFTQGQRGNQEFVLAIDTRTGKKAWETLTGKSFRERRGHGPRGTPTLDGDYLYAM